jgi:hypothetical protein
MFVCGACRLVGATGEEFCPERDAVLVLRVLRCAGGSGFPSGFLPRDGWVYSVLLRTFFAEPVSACGVTRGVRLVCNVALALSAHYGSVPGSWRLSRFSIPLRMAVIKTDFGFGFAFHSVVHCRPFPLYPGMLRLL